MSERDTLAAAVSDALAAATEGEDYTQAPVYSDEPGSPYVMRLTDELLAAGVRVAPSPDAPGPCAMDCEWCRQAASIGGLVSQVFAPSPDAPGLRDPYPYESRASLIHRIELLTADLAAAERRALPPRDALDVERLARAIVAIGYITDPDVAESVATRFAREYAAQSKEPTP